MTIADPEVLVDRAKVAAGLCDFGADGWQSGLQRLVAAITIDIGSDPEAVGRIEALVVRRLVTRLKIEEWYATHASQAAHPVEGPVVIFGLPRTGTTALHHLLAVDPQFRYPRTWEVANPLPPPDAVSEGEDPRRLQSPGRHGDVRHIASLDGPTEDGMIYGLHFHNQEAGLPVPSYTAWWRTADQSSAFAYHDRVLRLLHSRRPPYHWLVKAPAYLFHLTQCVKQYSGAWFIMTHRDPAVAIPSACSIVQEARQRQVPSWSPDLAAFGQETLGHFLVGAQRAIAAREVLDEDRFIDVGQNDLETDGVGTVERIYEFLDMRLPSEVRTAMSQWVIDNRRGSRGEHRYRGEDYGLTEPGIRAAYRDYIARFGPFCQ